jgi:hypothetical protein
MSETLNRLGNIGMQFQDSLSSVYVSEVYRTMLLCLTPKLCFPTRRFLRHLLNGVTAKTCCDSYGPHPSCRLCLDWDDVEACHGH